MLTEQPSALTPESQNLNRFYGTRPPNRELLREEAWHRTAAYLFATGDKTTKQIAGILDKNPATINNLFRQTWFQERVTQIMATEGTADVMALFKAEAMNCLQVVVEIRDNPKVSAASRLTALKEILDRGYGKSLAKVEHSEKPENEDPVQECARLEAEIKRKSL